MTSFNGSITTTGTSEAIRLDKALFRLHPEFRQKAKVRAHVIGPGQLLISVIEEEGVCPPEDDPVVTAFLGFLDADMFKHPERITSLSASRIGEAVTLTEGVSVSDDDSLPGDVSL
jgi:antitoxin PrlF